MVERFVEDVDLIQVGARNMQNFDLLKELGKTNKPIPASFTMYPVRKRKT